MEILYVANHNQRISADDEGAIADALTKLGHKVHCVSEDNSCLINGNPPGDFLLFHHWERLDVAASIRKPKVFWYFDLIDSRMDQQLILHSESRQKWMKRAMEICDLGFCTDGDWVQANPKKLEWLPQGADQRIAGPPPYGREGGTPILFTGTIDPRPILFTGCMDGGRRCRKEWVANMKTHWGDRFLHVQQGVYQDQLRYVMGKAKIVVAPESPCTDLYWSNRVWVACGFGAFVLHPFCQALSFMYWAGKEIMYYHSREEMHELIRYFLTDDLKREEIARAGLARTLGEHTYTHRCKTLVDTVARRLF
jgi:hypothetical protein